MENEKSRMEKIEEKMDIILEQGIKKKKFKLPRKARISKRKLKSGYVTVVVMNDNHNIDFIKEEIEGSTIRLGDTWHAIEDEDIFFFKGKPIIFLPKKRKNPYNPLKLPNETYGQKHIMARMKNDVIKVKRKLGGVIIWVILGLGALYFITQGL